MIIMMPNYGSHHKVNNEIETSLDKAHCVHSLAKFRDLEFSLDPRNGCYTWKQRYYLPEWRRISDIDPSVHDFESIMAEKMIESSTIL